MTLALVYERMKDFPKARDAYEQASLDQAQLRLRAK